MLYVKPPMLWPNHRLATYSIAQSRYSECVEKWLTIPAWAYYLYRNEWTCPVQQQTDGLMQMEVTCHPVYLIENAFKLFFFPPPQEAIKSWEVCCHIASGTTVNTQPTLPGSHFIRSATVETRDSTQLRPESFLIYRVSVSWYLHLYTWLSGPVAIKQ